ncbi:lysylphosphatidylglycerol biosynthesis bifunctional LysX domain protein [Mycobacterium kansasii 662]|uniref:Lysylphosphatidylglycerol biosynthesis bifunctional LysX domain protein n=1 Tax=Mycobacterium kansasii 662 TaxID=1299326 RepID=X7XS43_MYCKA|nr:lysylphosphatidylglycerol biosynthesis bifunctional LysX domain protein [Mycobacterium kansasii 662]
MLLAGGAIGILISWGLVELFPGSLAAPDRLPYVANRVVGFALADPDLFTGRPHVFLNAIFGLFGAFALIAATIVLFQSQRADNALTGEDESAIRGLLELYGNSDSLGYFAHSSRQVGGIRTQWPRRRHVPRRDRSLSGQR